MEAITITREMAQEIADALNEANKRAKQTAHRDAEGYKVALKTLENSEDELYKDLKSGILDDSAFKRQLSKVRVDRDYYTNLLLKCQDTTFDGMMETAQSILELAISAKSLWRTRSKEERVEFLKKILSNPKLNGLTIQFEMKKPFSLLAKMAQSSNWLPGQDSNL